MSDGRWPIPDDWSWMTIAQIGDVVGGGTPSTTEPANFAEPGTGIPWLTPADLARDKRTFVDRGSRDLSPKGLSGSGARLLPQGAVLFTSRAPIGYCAVAANPLSTNQGFKSIVVNAAKVEPEWLRYYLLGSKQYAESFASGSTFKELSGARVRELEVPLPPLDEQRRIVAKLDALRARSRRAKEALDAVPALLDRLRQSILAAAFRGDLTADWREANPDVEPASELLKRIRIERRTRLSMGSKRGREFVASPDAGEQHDTWFGDPEARGWFLESLDNLCDPVRGIPYGIVQTGEPDPDGVPTVRCGDIKGFEIDRAGLKRVRASIESGYERTRLAGGEVLLAIRGTVGQTAVAGPELHGANISREVAMIPLLAGIEPTFVMYLLASPAGQAMLGQHVKGVAQAGINLADLRALRVPIPSRAEQARVVAEVERGLSVVNRMQRRTLEVGSESAELDRALLSAAFRGQLLDRQSSPGLDV